MLYECYAKARAHEDITEIFGEVSERYNSIIRELGLDFDISGELEYVKNAILHRSGSDYAASRGEYINGLILAKYLGFSFVDAENVIFFRDDSSFNDDYTNEMLSAELKKYEYAVIPGFYGIMPNGTIKTFSRGGSDVTGSLVARAVEADLYENWTDVSGFKMADPRIISKPRTIDEITYRELRELSFMGASVLHDEAIFPVRGAGIPINIRNTNSPEKKGTMIVSTAQTPVSDEVITGIAGKKGFSVITIERDKMNSIVGFARRVLEVFEEYSIPVEHLPNGIDTMSVIIQTALVDGVREKILNSINRSVRPDSVTIDDGLALIAVVGRGMVKAKGTAARVFNSVSQAEVNIRMIDQGSSELNIIIGVDENDFEKTLRAIYNEFVG
jgi:aspartate kinase